MVKKLFSLLLAAFLSLGVEAQQSKTLSGTYVNIDATKNISLSAGENIRIAADVDGTQKTWVFNGTTGVLEGAVSASTLTLPNDTYLKATDAAASSTLSLLKGDSSDNTILNTKTGKSILFDVAATAEATLSDDKIVFSGASFKFVPGATSLIFRNNADSSSNLVITDAGAATLRSTLTTTGLNFPAANYESVPGAGTDVTNAAALSATKHIHRITGADSFVGWKFATSTAGQFEVLLNTTVGVPNIYAATGGTCNGGAANDPCVLLTGVRSHICYSTAADTWICA